MDLSLSLWTGKEEPTPKKVKGASHLQERYGHLVGRLSGGGQEN